MAEESDLEKTEEPTPHKQEKAREKGQIARSRELTSMLMLIAGLGLLWSSGGIIAEYLRQMVTQGLQFDHRLIGNDRQMLQHIVTLLKLTFFAAWPFILGLIIVAISAPLLVGGLLFSTESFKFDLKRMNPISGLKRIFSMQAMAELLKAILKSVLVFSVAGLYLWEHWAEIIHLMTLPTSKALQEGLVLIVICGLLIALGLTPMVVFDVFYQIWSNLKKLRMTKQEIKDEFKEQEGDPHVKGYIRQQQRAMARRRMMADVPKADVIVTNPTHYAVALQYQENKMSAPKVLAKGAGEVALRIKELGAEHRIPMLEAPPLARALYRHSEIGQAIPATLYAAVAEVLAWVYHLKRWRRVGGSAPKKPENLPVPDALDFAKESETHG